MTVVKFSLAHLTVMGCTPPELIRIAAKAGYDYVSLRTICMGLPGEADYEISRNQDLFDRTKTALQETGLKLYDIELARIQDGLDVGQYEPALRAAASLGAKSVLSSIWTPNKNYYIEQFAKLCDLGYKYGLNVDLEFVTWASVHNLQEAFEVLTAVNRSNSGVMVDTLHFHRSCVKLKELDAIPAQMFHFCHVCDAPPEIPTDLEGLIHTGRDERYYAGDGGINIAAILRKIPARIYSLELPNIQRVKEVGYTEHARRCLEKTKEYFIRHGLSY